MTASRVSKDRSPAINCLARASAPIYHHPLSTSTLPAMNTTEVLSYLDLLEDNLDGLEESLKDLVPADSVAEGSKKLPLLDRAKLHVTVVYAIESLLFCTKRPYLIDSGWLTRLSIPPPAQHIPPFAPGLQGTGPCQIILRQDQGD